VVDNAATGKVAGEAIQVTGNATYQELGVSLLLVILYEAYFQSFGFYAEHWTIPIDKYGVPGCHLAHLALAVLAATRAVDLRKQLWPLDVEGIDFWGADITGEQRRVVRSKAKPVLERSGG
jgi:hypothetical protein